MRNRYLSWRDVCGLIDHIISQLNGDFDAVIAISRGGIVPGGLISKKLDIRRVFIAAVSFFRDDDQALDWPVFLQFPDDQVLRGKRILVVGDKWRQGRAITSVRERVEMAGAEAVTVVLHYCPGDSASPDQKPDVLGEQTDESIIYPWQATRSRLEV